MTLAGVAEWQTRETQNLVWATKCRFDPDHRHHTKKIHGQLSKLSVRVFFLTEYRYKKALLMQDFLFYKFIS